MPSAQQVHELNPQDIARTLFNGQPQTENSIEFVNAEQSDPVTLFEILLHILAEGLVIKSNAPPSNHTIDSIMCLEPYFRSIGFRLVVEQFAKNPREAYGKYYCRTIFRTPTNVVLFEAKHLDIDYHFLINGDTYDENMETQQISQLFTIVESQQPDAIFSVHFHPLSQ